MQDTKSKQQLAQLAERFRQWHHDEQILVIPNAWDVASARIFADCGAKAIGTTSMGISAVAGYPDIQQLSREEMLAAIHNIAKSVSIAVTADLESGYGDSPEQVAESVELAVQTGVVGVNLEDGTGNPDAPLVETPFHADRIRATRERLNRFGVPVVINARTDVFLSNAREPGQRLAETIRRGHAYREAGADCLFVPGGMDTATILELTRQLDIPLNVVANPAISTPVVPSIPELQELCVARVSVGSGPLRATLALTRRIAEELLGPGTYESMKQELDAEGAVDAYRAAIRSSNPS